MVFLKEYFKKSDFEKISSRQKSMKKFPKSQYLYVYKKFGKILSIRSQAIEPYDILTSVKGHNSVIIVRKMMCNNPNLDLVYKIWKNSIKYVLKIDIEQKRYSDISQGP